MIEDYITQKNITYFIIIFIGLYIIISLIKFIGQLPILIIISLLITYYYHIRSNIISNNKVELTVEEES